MRILRVAQKLYPDEKGGGAYHAHAMSRDQAAAGHDVTAVTTGSGPPREHRDGYTVLRRPVLFEPLGNEISPGVANVLRRAGSYDVVHAHSHLYFSTNLAALARRLTDTPLAITNHGLYSQTAPEAVFDVYLRTLGRWTFDQADCVFTYTASERRALRDLGVASPVEVVANGIDTDRFAPEGPVDGRLESPAVLFVGRLVEGKRPVDAVRAVAAVRERGVDAKLYVAGTGPLESQMKQVAADRGMTESATFLGHVPYDDMPGLYRAADALLLPSRDEGLPRTILESMATRTPVVASDLEQISRMLDDGGVTVPVGDVESFAAALERILTTPDLRDRLGADGREAVVADWTWRSTVSLTTDVLSSLARGRTPSTGGSA